MSAESLRRTPLYEEHLRLGAKIVPFAGWEMPIQYVGISKEHEAVRTRAGLFDVSHMGELELRGERALELVNGLVTNDLNRVSDGQAMYTCCCNERGTILDDLIIYRRSPQDILVVCNASNRDKIVGHFRSQIAKDCDFKDVSDETALIALQGPRALEILAGSGLDFSANELPSFRFRNGKLKGIPVTVARTGYTGEDGVEIFAPWAEAAKVWQALTESGKAFGIEATGLGARDTLRLEARLSLYGNEIDETTNPIEAGLSWTVKLDKPEFLGRDAILSVKNEGPKRTIVGFEMTGRGIARHGYPLLDKSGRVVGQCTSGGPSPTLGKNIGLGYLPLELSAVGTEFLVDCRGKQIEAVVVKTPFYKRARA